MTLSLSVHHFVPINYRLKNMKQTKALHVRSPDKKGNPKKKICAKEWKARTEASLGIACMSCGRSSVLIPLEAPFNSTQYLIDVHQDYYDSVEEDFGSMLDRCT